MNKGVSGLTGYRNQATSRFQGIPPNAGDTDRTDSYRRTGEKKVTDFQSHKAADISNDIVSPEQHIGSMPLLYRFPVYIQVEMKILHIGQSFHRYKCANGSGTIETFT